ncbi:MAG: glycosyltransferase family 4 protein [Clostridia bacterium]|nr:glycosyltransferase family 4 protein [Clostridia bacterium]
MNEKKKILIYANYFYPEYASIAQILTELCLKLQETYEVTVICSVPCYTGTIEEKYKKRRYYYEELDEIKIIRVRVRDFTKSNKKSRVLHILSYFLNSIGATFKVGKQDIVYAVSQPPILGGLLGVIGKWIKHAKYIYNIQDFNPEQTMAVKYSKSKLITNIMMFLDKFSCRRSNLIITVGRDLVETVKNRFQNKKVPKTVFINNWIDEKQIYPLDSNNEKVQEFKRKYKLEDKFIMMYSGNMGLYYDLENIFKVLEKIKPGVKATNGQEVIFTFIGEGTVLEKLKKYKEEKKMDNVIFIPYQEKKDLIYSLNAANVHFCINAKGIKGVSCPSKYYGIAAAGKPILGVLEEDTEIRLLIEETNGGLVSNPGEYDCIEKNINWFIEHANSEELENMGKRNREYLEKNLTKDISINKYREEILKL